MTERPETVKTTFHVYHFDLTTVAGQEAYDKHLVYLRDKRGLKKISFSNDMLANRSVWWKDIGDVPVVLDTKYLFADQWNTVEEQETSLLSNRRIFDWYEFYHDTHFCPINRYGYWLEQTDEIRELRKLTLKCRYCGAQYFNTEQRWCLKCIGGELLKESELHLLRLVPVADFWKDVEEPVCVPEAIIEMHCKRKMENKERKRQAKVLEYAELLKQVADWLKGHPNDDIQDIFWKLSAVRGKHYLGWSRDQLLARTKR